MRVPTRSAKHFGSFGFPFLFALGLLSGCGVGELFGGGMCDLSAADVCVDFPDALPHATATSACDTFKSTFNSTSKEFNATTSCAERNPIKTALGTCVVDTSGLESTITYYNNIWVIGAAQTSCTNANGTFTAAR